MDLCKIFSHFFVESLNSTHFHKIVKWFIPTLFPNSVSSAFPHLILGLHWKSQWVLVPCLNGGVELVWNRVSLTLAGFKLCGPGQPHRDPPASASWVLELEVCTTTLSYLIFKLPSLKEKPGTRGVDWRELTLWSWGLGWLAGGL